MQINYEGSDPEVKPLLTWIPGDPTYKDRGVDKDQVYAGTTTLNFKVRYIYDDGQGGTGRRPGSAKLLIDLNGNREQDADDLLIDLEEVDPNDQDYSDGKDYKAENVTIATDASNNIGYRFLFTSEDGKEADGDPARTNLITAIQDSGSSDSSKLCFISSLKISP